MKTTSTLIMLMLLIPSMLLFAQEEETSSVIQEKIEKLEREKEGIRNDEKRKLKAAVFAIDTRLKNNEINQEEADRLKKEAAEKHALNIENRLAIVDNKIELLKRNNSLAWEENDGLSGEFIQIGWGVEDGEDAQLFGVRVGHDAEKREKKYDRRTYSDVVWAFGLNNALIEGQSLNESPYKFGDSRFFELGYQWRTRVFRNSNWLRFHYGFSFQFNGLNLEGDQIFVENGNQTEIEQFPVQLDKSKFRMDNLVIPLHLEFGPSKTREYKDRIRYSLRRQFRVGLGGYAGFNLSSRQKLKYVENGIRQKEKRVSDYNTSNVIYGLSSYVGVGGTTFYVKYDLNPIFQDAQVEQNNISFGLRFDL
jgi:hypothetical protein